MIRIAIPQEAFDAIVETMLLRLVSPSPILRSTWE
jgi:hypothetical protein